MINLSPGTVLFGKYRLERLLGRGGFAEVYLATHVHLNVPRALKVLTRGGKVTTRVLHSIVQRFQLEARLGAHFAQEPHIVRVYDFERDPERNLFVLVMEYMAGGTLEERIQQAKEAGAPGLPVDEVVRTAYHAALGLAALHREGLVHRDIKPSNILYDEKGNAKIADLGVVQMPHGLTRRTELGDTAPRHPGTPEYMSPEQVTTTAYLPPASDIYSLGATLFEALTLQKYKHLRPGTRVSQLRPDVPGWLDELIARMLAEDPRARPWDGMELAREIEAHMAPGAAPPRPTDVYETAGPKARRPASGPSPDALLPTRTEEMPWASPVVRPRPRPHRRAASQAARQRQMLVLALLFIAVLGTCVGFAAVGWWLVRSDRAAPAPTVAPAQQTTLPAAPAGATSGPTRPQATTAPAAQQQAAPQPAAPSPTPVPIQTPVTSQPVVSTPPLPLFPDPQRYGILGNNTLPVVFVFDRSAWRVIEPGFGRPEWARTIASRTVPSCRMYIEVMEDYVGPIWEVNIYGFAYSWILLFNDSADEWHVYLWHLVDSALPEKYPETGLSIDFFASGEYIEQCTTQALSVLGALQYHEENARQCRLIAQAPYRPGDTIYIQREVQAYQWPRWAMSAWMQSLPPGTTLRILGQPVCAATPQGPTLAWPVQWPGGQGWVLQAELDGVVGKPPAQAFPKGEPPVMWRKLCAEAPPSWMAVGVQGEVCTKEDRVRVRSKPGRKGGRIAWAYPGMRFRVIGGPECGDGWVWWEVEFENGIVGWIAEGPDPRDPKFICPLSP